MTPSARPTLFAKRLLASLISALAVAAVAHGVSTLAFFVTNDPVASGLDRISSYFLPVSLVGFVVAALLGLAGGFTRWFLALITGVLAGIIGAVIGTSISVGISGNTLTPELLPAIFGTIIGINLLFIAAMTVAAVTLGTAVWRALKGSRLLGWATPTRKVAMVRLPASNMSEGELTHLERQAVDSDLADQQWDGYVDALVSAGWEIVEVGPEPTMPDSVFVEDAVVVFGKTAVITSPGAQSRRGELGAVESTARELGLRIERISLPGTLDGGDVLKVGTTVYVGRGGRTNAEGIRQLRSIVSALGFTVVAVPVTKVLHLKSAVTALPDGTVIGYPPLVENPSLFDRFLPVPEEGGAHVVVLSPDTVLMASSAPKSTELIESLGYRVVTVDISEFEKLEGCVTCLSVRVR